MKIIILAFAVLCLTIAGCNTAKHSKTTAYLEGTWQLNYITGPRIAFNDLYPGKKPTITFDLKENRVSGTNSCNYYFAALNVDAKTINFTDVKMGITKMACPGEGETIFMRGLERINSYSMSEDRKTLNFLVDNFAIMRFEKQVIDSHNSQNAIDWQGIYKGITPCADCEGIETEVILNTDLTYVIKTKYLGKGDGKVFEEKGRFVWDQTGGSISLQGSKGGPSQYKVGENRLIHLDMDGNVIKGPLAEMYVLKK